MRVLSLSWILFWGLVSLMALQPLVAQEEADEEAQDEETVVWEYRIQKRGGGEGAFAGWFMNIDTTAKSENDQVTNLTSTWHGKMPSAVWEIRRAGQYNGVDAVYIINKGESGFGDWYLGIQEDSGALNLHKSPASSTTKWVLRWVGRAGKYDLFQIRNAGLTRFTGSYVALNEQANASTGVAANIALHNNGRDPRTFWSLERYFRETPEEVQEAAAPKPRY